MGHLCALRYVTSGLMGAVEPEEFVRNATFKRGRVLGNADEDAETRKPQVTPPYSPRASG